MMPSMNKTDRMMANIAIAILSLGACFAAFSLGRPLYWRFYATVIRPFEDHGIGVLGDDPFASVLDSRSMPGSQASTARTDIQNTATKLVERTAAVVLEKVVAPVVKAVKGPFNVDDYPLNKERAMQYSEKGYVMVTWTNNHYLDFAVSWVANIRKVGLQGYMVGAMDDEVLQSLVDLDITTWRMNTGITKKDLGWGSPNFHKMGRFKISLIKQFLELGVMVIISDIDTAWSRNPLPYFDRYPEADILTSSDHLAPTVKDDSLERFPDAGSAFNIGIMMFRLTARDFVDTWIKKLNDPQMWDQNAFNDVARKGHGLSNERGLWKGYDGKLTFGVLPVSLFASGHVYFVQRKHEELGLQAYVAHATFQYSGTSGKRHRFREALLWTDPPSYFDHDVGFLRYDLDIPADLLAKAIRVQGEMTVDKLDSHFNLVNHQLLHLRTAIAVATITRRVLVLPPIMCVLDKYWAPLQDGSIPGSVFHVPFICPMDHILDLEGSWAPKKDEQEWGPHVEFREFSFFQNPRMSQAVNESRVRVEVCPVGTAGCATTGRPEIKGNQVRISAGLDSAQLAEVLQGLAQYKVLDFNTMANLFTKFTDTAAQARYLTRLKHYTTVFCCLNSNPGWVWYDFLWDQPHTDRLGRKFETWQIRQGDQQTGRRALLGLAADGAGSLSLQQMGQQAMLGLT